MVRNPATGNRQESDMEEFIPPQLVKSSMPTAMVRQTYSRK